MKTRIQDTLGFNVKLPVPDTIEEAVALAGSPSAVVDGWLDDEIFRGWLPSVRRAIVKTLNDTTTVKRKVTGKGPARKDGSAPDVYEKDTIYIRRVKADAGLTPEQLQKIAQDSADSIKFDPSETSSTSGRVAKKFLVAAQGIIDAVASGAATWDIVLGNFASENPDFEMEIDEATGAPTVESLASGLRYDEDRIVKERASASRFTKVA